jgi:hypothetical protein
MCDVLSPHDVRNSLEHLVRSRSVLCAHPRHCKVTASPEKEDTSVFCPWARALQREFTHRPCKQECSKADIPAPQIVIAVLNRYYNFHNVDDLGYVYFYVAEVATAVYVGNIPLCWPLFRRLVHGSAWSRDGSSGKTDDPNQPRTRTHSRFSKKRLNSSSLWTITRGGNTEWDKMDEEADSSKERVYRNELGVVQEDQSSTIELTPGWHHEAHSTTIHASRSRSPGSRSGDHTQDKDNIQVNITRTVEISTAEARHSYGHQTPHGI